ncbi:hypothetical protein MK805_14570 [Shimazuella sp. AN120528]|uniref:hypothetical protein n=1 Tax=Shimazuella soli TaxID=1892854 RepID=UPI001F0F3C10|nr:hypothetical protein [Shimazuella soli]MCH5586163.1 hypothetical protein [Shimazuella soli]
MEQIQLPSEAVMYRSASEKKIVFIKPQPKRARELLVSSDGVKFFEIGRFHTFGNTISVKTLRGPNTTLRRNGNEVTYDKYVGETFNKVVYRPSEITFVPLIRMPVHMFERPSDGQFLYVSRGLGLFLFIGDENRMSTQIDQFRNGSHGATLNTAEGQLVYNPNEGWWNGEKLIMRDPFLYLTSETEQGVQISM